MKVKIYSLLLLTLLFINGYSQTVTLSSTTCGTYPFTFATLDGTGRGIFGAIDDAIQWNASANQWEWTYFGSFPPTTYYVNSYASSPYPPCFNTGTWVQVNNTCGTLVDITGDCQTGLTGIDKNAGYGNYFSVLLNPGSGRISVLLQGVIEQNTKLSIFNSIGEKVHEQTILTPKTDITLSNQSSGVYVIQLHSNEGTFNKKILLSK